MLDDPVTAIMLVAGGKILGAPGSLAKKAGS
jgi:hypothetical protein